MISCKETIRKLRKHGRIYYFSNGKFSLQEKAIEDLSNTYRNFEVLSSIEQCTNIKIEKSEVLVLKNVTKIAGNSKYLIFFNESADGFEMLMKKKKFLKGYKKIVKEWPRVKQKTSLSKVYEILEKSINYIFATLFIFLLMFYLIFSLLPSRSGNIFAFGAIFIMILNVPNVFLGITVLDLCKWGAQLCKKQFNRLE